MAALGPRDAIHRTLDDDGGAIALVDLDGTIRHLSRPMLDLLDVGSAAQVAAGSASAGVLRSFLDQLPSELLRGEHTVWHGRVDHRTADGRQMVLRATASLDSAAESAELALLLHDITDTHAAMAALTHRATHDPLTGLANRRRILRRLTEAIGAQRAEPGLVAAIFVDLDNFAYVNDVFGHHAGDRLLAASADRLARVVRPADDVARVGADEFLVVARDVTDAVAALELAERARRALSGRLRIGDLDLDLSVSVGVSMTDNEALALSDEDAASTLISNAAAAAQDSKRNGRGRCSMFTPDMRTSARSRAAMATALATSLTNGDLDLKYQPIYSAMTRAPVGAEALVRWNHSTLGRVDARTIVAVAEESGLIERLGEFVLEHTLSNLARWSREGDVDGEFSVHVNVSRFQLSSPSFVNFVVDRLEQHGLEPRRLILEASESPLLGSESSVVRSIRALRRFGVLIAIDDFGTGAKSLAVLTDVGVDVLKLDGSLALPPGASATDMRVVRAIVALAHALDIDVIAERVSEPDQLPRLREAGCDMLQGNLLGGPVPAGAAHFATSELW